MALLTKNQILSADDRKTAIVDMTEEWGGEVKLVALSFKDSERLEKVRTEGTGSDIIRELVLLSCVDEHNNKLFNEEDIDAILSKDTNSLIKIFNAATQLNQVTEGKLEQEAKN